MLAQVEARSASLLQIGSASARAGAKRRVSAYLKQKAAALSSSTLATLASQILGNPFAKVIEMIESLIARLKEEAEAEAAANAWCAEQLKKNKLKRNKLTLET